MGTRGIGSALRKKVAAQPKRKKLPWDKPGLSRVAKITAFLQFLPITKGKLTGHKLKLLPDQLAFIESVYGARKPVQLGVFSQPRGNGKTGLTAGLSLCHLLGPEAEFRGECYSAAIDRQQAALIANEMEAIILQVPEFAELVNLTKWPHRKIEVTKGDHPGVGSIYRALSADAGRAFGLAPSFWCYDEFAQAKDRQLFDALQTAMGKRKRSLGVIISTQASTDDHPLSQVIDHGLKGIDPAIVVHLRAAPADADPFDRAVIDAVNPAFGKFLDADSVYSEAERAKAMPSFESAFRNLRLNQRIEVDGERAFIPLDVWEKCGAPINRDLFTDGRAVYGGLDLSARLDLTALVLACEDDDGRTHLWPFAWTPSETVHEHVLSDRAPFDAWVRAGDLLTTPGPSVDYDWIAAEIAKVVAPMNLIQINYDPYQKERIFEAFARIGFVPPMKDFAQNIRKFGPVMADFRVRAAEGRFRHGNHPVLKWCVMNTTTVRDHADNHKPDKRREFGRIDLAVAAVMAMGERLPVFISGAMIA